MAKSFDMTERYPSPANGRQAEQRSKATGGGKSPMDPMGGKCPGWSAAPCQNPSNTDGAMNDFGEHGLTEGKKK